MDDFNTNVLSEAKNEYTSRLLNILTPLVFQGFKSILNEATILCSNNDEHGKYLMTFQNFLSRIPKWNQEIIDTETKRIIETSKCNYLDELITCVHITQLKLLTSVRVSSEHKKLDIAVPKLNDFIHKVYIEIARKLYKCVYLFEDNILPLLQQKNRRECELIIREGILNTIRESIPIDKILRAYLDETQEEEIVEETTMMPLTDKEEKEAVEKEAREAREELEAKEKEEREAREEREAKENEEREAREKLEAKEKEEREENGMSETNEHSGLTGNLNLGGTKENKLTEFLNKSVSNFNDTKKIENVDLQEPDKSNIKFNNLDNVVNFDKGESPEKIQTTEINTITAPKTIDRLEKLSHERFQKRKEEEEEEDDDDSDADDDYDDKIQILSTEPSVKIDDIEVLDDPLILKKDVLQFDELY